MPVWVHFPAAISESFKKTLSSSLAQAGIASCDMGARRPTDRGIVFFDEVTDSVCELLRNVTHADSERVFAIALSGSALKNGTWQLLQAGASEVFAWDHSLSPASEVAARLERWESIDHLLESPLVRQTLIGDGAAWRKMVRRIVELARFTTADLLVFGETGTGKELVARLVHGLDARENRGELVVLDCSTIVPELSGSEFFGHERGAFTGASQAREGAFALADRGTLFLDEVGELPLALQGQLLRVVQERTYKRVGGNSWCSTDFRLVCATNRDLREAVHLGTFRHDLYYRIASWTLRLPPLRERTQDIPRLVQHFAGQNHPERSAAELDGAVSEYLINRDYPGNIRELRQVVLRIMDRHTGPGPITVADIPEDEWPLGDRSSTPWCDEAFERAIYRALASGVGLKEIGRTAEQVAVAIAVTEEHGSLQRAARRLGVSDRALQIRRAHGGRGMHSH
jgi:transcriptional regulator with GAF, ATPase, and Fis domain